MDDLDLPDLSSLSLNGSSVRAQWIEACGTRPAFKGWKSMRAADKYKLLHGVAAKADDDTRPDGDYLSAYEQVDIDDMLSGTRQWSVEHVVPRSHINGRESSPSENDPLGWIEATAMANSRRSNHPLYLWPDLGSGKFAPPNRLVRVDGEVHYVPPLEQRARLARKWLFIRATYVGIQPPSTAQKRHAANIVALAQYDPIYPAERRVNEHYRNTLGWANPLLEEGAEKWYANVAFRALAFK